MHLQTDDTRVVFWAKSIKFVIAKNVIRIGWTIWALDFLLFSYFRNYGALHLEYNFAQLRLI